MSAGNPPLQPDPAWLQAFATLMSRIDAALGPAKPKKPVVICIAGGAAMHFYTGERYSRDVDAKIFARVMIDPQELQVAYQGHDGRARLLYFDTQYNDSFALLHHAAYDDARPVSIDGIAASRLNVRLLQPVDLAVSKLSRFSEQDQDDIRALARHGLITAAALRKRAETSLHDYVGNLERIRNSITIASRQVDEITRGKAGNGL
ncbi:MAG: hypothetical protein K2Y31_01930 [Burkholderiales bacterium]|jgi:hypothetical protein|nr:hypothetical protein [Burkholderiales bacterium]